MPGTTSTALPSFSHDQHHKTDAAKWKGADSRVITETGTSGIILLNDTSRTKSLASSLALNEFVWLSPYEKYLNVV